MFTIVHHNDDDGRCAAFIVRQFVLPLAKFTPADFIEYNNSGNLADKTPDIKGGDSVYIVDISLSDSVAEFINNVIDKGGYVIHIDHHASGIDYYNNHKEIFESYGKQYKHFFKVGISGTMLTWIYAEVFDEDDLEYPMDVKFDFDDDDRRRKCCKINDKGEPIGVDGNVIGDERLIMSIPDVVRFIDDYDIFKHKIPESKYFFYGFKLVENKHPLNHIWMELFDQGSSREQNELIQNLIDKGDIIMQYRKAVDATVLKSGFMIDINGHEVCCLNLPEGNSMAFQEMYDYCDAVCKYHFDGVKYWYTFYSNDDGANVLELIDYIKNKYGEEYGFITGGGHKHAGGCTMYKNVLPAIGINKQIFTEKRRDIRIEMEVAAEQRRLEMEQEKIRKEQEKLARIRAKIIANTPDDEDEDETYEGI